MTKRLFSLGLMIILAIGAWADDPVAINKTTLWTFGSLATGSFTDTPHEINGLYASGASITEGSSIDVSVTKPTDAAELAIFDAYFPTSVTKYLALGNGANSNIANSVKANEQVNNGAAFYASVPGTVYVYASVSNAETKFRIYDTPGNTYYTRTDLSTGTSPELLSRTVSSASNIFMRSAASSASANIYAILFIPTEKVATPTISYANGQVTISGGTSSTSANTTIYYTTDGSTPTASSTLYTVPFDADAGTTIKAISISDNGPESLVASITLTNYTLTVEATGGEVKAGDGSALASQFVEGSDITLRAYPDSINNYQFTKWLDLNNENAILGTHRLLTISNISSNQHIQAVFTQKPTEASQISISKTWTFENFTNGTPLSYNTTYEMDGLYISGHANNNPTTVNDVSDLSVTLGTASNISCPQYLYFTGGKEKKGDDVKAYAQDNAAFYAAKPGKVYAYMSGRSGKNFIIYSNAATSSYKQAVGVEKAKEIASTEISNAGPVYIGSDGIHELYALRYEPETVTAPTINADGTITAGSTNLTDNVDIEVRYTIDGNTPTAESTLYDTKVVANGTVTVKAITVNTSTGSISDVATQEITIVLPSYSFNASVETAETGTLTYKVEGATENSTATEFEEGTRVVLTATPAEGYYFVEWKDGSDNRLTTLSTYTVTISAATTIKAVFKQPASPAPEITTATTWTFNDFTEGTILSDNTTYEYNGLYIYGNWTGSGSNQAVISAKDGSVTIGGEEINYSKALKFQGSFNSPSASKTANTANKNSAAFKVGTSGIVYANMQNLSSTARNLIISNNGGTRKVEQSAESNVIATISLDVFKDDHVFFGASSTNQIFVIKFIPEVVEAPVISVSESIGTITEGTSNLTTDDNKNIKTYYTIDGSEPTEESLLYEGVIMASGKDITVKAVSINTVTGVKSEVTTETGLTLTLPSQTFNATVGTTGAGTVTWKKAGTDEAQASSYKKGTSIEVTATATGNYMFLNWTKGDEVVAKTPVYTFTLMEDTELVANFKDMGNTVPVILTAGQSNTDGRIQTSETAFPYDLNHTLISYCNGVNYTTEGEFITYGTTPMSDSGERWGYDAVVYHQIQTELGNEKDFYVIKQSKGNTGISPASGGVGMFWSANPVWLTYNTSANKGGKSLLKALCDQIDASLDYLPAGKTADIKFLMWHQGECDKNQSGAYETQLKAMINYVRNHLVTKTGNNKYSQLPVILGGIIPVPSDVKGCEYSEAVENAKQSVAAADEHIYYIDVADLGSNYANYLRSDNVHFNAAGATEFGNRVWQVIRDNNLLAGLVDGTGSTTPVNDILKKSDPVAGSTSWNFNEQTEGDYTTLTDMNGLYLHSSSSKKMTVLAAGTEVTYIDNTTVSTTKYLQVSPAGDRSKFMSYGLTAGDVVDMDRVIGVNTSEAGTFYAIVAPDTEPKPNTEQTTRNMYLVFNGEKVATANVATAWGKDKHVVTLKYQADKAGTFFLTSEHAYRLYAAKFVKAGEETGGFTITTVAEGGTITMTAPTGKTLADVFSKNEEVTLKATANEDYAFVKWTDGNDNELGTNTTLNITVDSDITIKAIFKFTLETVSAPTLEGRNEINKVTLRLGTSSLGNTVTAYYTIDGSTPTTRSTKVTKNGAITVDESCTIKAYCVSETSVASGVTEYTVTLPTASKSASKVYDWLNVVQHGDTIAFSTDGLTVYNMEYDATNPWATKQRKDFNAATTFDSKVSVRNGAKGLTYDTKNKTIRLTKPMAIHNLAVGDEIVIIYTGDGTLRSGGADEGDAFTINGTAATLGMAIPSGASIKVTKEKYINNYVVVTPSGPTSGKVYISAIYINHAAPTVANTPKAELASVDLDKMTSTYRITFDKGATLFYILEADGSTVTGSNTGIYDLTIAEGDKLKAWEVNGTLTSDTLKTTVYAPTPAPSTEGDFDFTEASEELPADIEVTLDAYNKVSVGGETLYKPSLLTAATFNDKFAFTETGSSNKIRIRTNHQLVFAKGTNMSMGLLNLKKGDVISFDYTGGGITFADPSQVSVESTPATARAATRSETGNELTSGVAYIVKADCSVLLNMELTEASTSISKMYIAAAPTTSAAKALDFASAAEEYEELNVGNTTSVWFNGKTSGQTFKRLANVSEELPIDGKISTESGSGSITIDGITAANRHIAIHNLAVGDQILVRFYGGALTFDGHETKGNRVSVDGKLLTAQDTLKTGDVIVINKVDYLNNYVVLKLDSKCSISGIFINRDETEKVWAPTITESGKNTVLITAGRSSMEKEVTTYYTIDGTTPSELNGIGGPYPTFDVELLDGALVEVKAVSYSSSGERSKVTTLVMFADTRTEILGVPVEDNKESIIYDLSGRRVDTPRPGQIYIINGKKVLYKRK